MYIFITPKWTSALTYLYYYYHFHMCCKRDWDIPSTDYANVYIIFVGCDLILQYCTLAPATVRKQLIRLLDWIDCAGKWLRLHVLHQ